MTILETFIKLRDDLKAWVTNNLNQKANISYVDEKFDSISEFDPTEIQEAIDTNTAAIDTKVDKVEGKDLSTNDYTTAEKDKLSTVEANANFYEHPAHTSHSSGLYKITVDGSGHVSGATLAEKDDIVALGIPGEDTKYDTEISDFEKRISYIEDDFIGVDGKFTNLFNEFAEYKEQNNDAIADNASKVQANQQAIENIQNDYLTSTDKTQLQDGINEASNKATANAAAIEKLNGEGDGSVKQSIDNAFNEFAANVSDDKVVNTYKELIDYAAKHGPEFTELVGKVDTINTHVGEIETDLSNYKTAVSDQFAEVDTTINDHVADEKNPHNVTKDQIGLDQVDNTPDMDKPISHAVDEALQGKADSEHMHEIGHIDSLQDLLDELRADIDTNAEDIDTKADLEHAHNDLYYTKDETLEFITVEDIDNICDATIHSANVAYQSEAPTDTSVLWVDIDDDTVDEFSGGYIIQSTAPSDTSVVWIDPSDNSDNKFQEAVNIALAQAKASGEFDGEPYKLTDEDKTAIVSAVLSALPVYSGEVI